MKHFMAAAVMVLPLAALAGSPSGEHLVYTVGCVNCHHQTAKEIINAPPLIIVKAYSLPELSAISVYARSR